MDRMVESGLLEEARKICAQKDLKTAYQAIGYKELEGYFAGRLSLSQALDTLKQESRRYAKRQLTWFRRERDVIWIDRQKTGQDEKKIVDYMLNILTEKHIIPGNGSGQE